MQNNKPVNQKKRCNTCGKLKSLEMFGKNKQNGDGLQYKCKMCFHLKLKVPRDNKINDDDNFFYLRLVNGGIGDYVACFRFLQAIGYDVKKPIHKQFVEKYKLPYKSRLQKARNHYPKKEILAKLFDIS